MIFFVEGSRVLIVEDDELVRRALARRLAMVGCEVELSHDGLDGLQKCKSWSPRVVIIDRRLPRLNGDDLARCIGEQIKDVPAVFMLTGEPTHSLGPMPGVVRLFSKPVSFDRIYAAIAPYLEP